MCVNYIVGESLEEVNKHSGNKKNTVCMWSWQGQNSKQLKVESCEVLEKGKIFKTKKLASY